MGTAALIFLCAPSVQAEPDKPVAATSVPSVPRVDIIVVGEGQTLDALPDKIASWFGMANQLVRPYRVQRLDPRSVLTSGTGSGMRVWVFVENGGMVRLYFSVQEQPGQPARYLTNEIMLLRGLDELGLEQVSQVAYLSTMALWEGRLETPRVDVERQLDTNAATTAAPVATTESKVVVPPVSTAAPDPNHREKSVLLVRAGVAYGFRWRGGERSAQGPAVKLSTTSLHNSLEIGGHFQAQLLLPQELNKDGIDLRLSGYAPAAGVSIGLILAHQILASAEIGLGLDIVRRETVRVSAEYQQPRSSAWDIRPIHYTSLVARGAFGRVGLAVAATLSVQWVRVHYDTIQANRAQEILVPWRVQPGGYLGIDW